MRRTGAREREREREREDVWTYRPFEIPFTIAAIRVTKSALRVRFQPGILSADVPSYAIGQVCVSVICVAPSESIMHRERKHVMQKAGWQAQQRCSSLSISLSESWQNAVKFYAPALSPRIALPYRT